MQRLLPYLPLHIARGAAALPSAIAEGVTEIRLRLGGPVSVTALGKNHCFNSQGKLCPAEKAIVCTKEDVQSCLALLTHASLYSYGDTVRNGYIPFGNGCRAGVCGRGIVHGGKLTGFSEVYGINLRLCRYIKDYGIAAARYIGGTPLKGALVYSPPNKGKTTLLRSIAAQLARTLRVALADERGELYVPELNGTLTDVISGVNKSVAIPLLCRSMSPQVIVCDELAPEDEAALINALGAGVCIVASAHGESAAGVLARPYIGRLAATGAFPLLIGIGEDFSYTVEEYGL